eukprot:CAMPEP_0119396616 /NCGR_PEP_ID=MMETSP1334-20130426/137640_1 /TAXON_ID=127549 /ORGANISM="Calcidiscus leptoporus, Strain RCC1130" /LENGTH=40 /DNA_ID= /DNA_START= /DNA_END= /DNA_ORIENTATION=
MQDHEHDCIHERRDLALVVSSDQRDEGKRGEHDNNDFGEE